MLSLSVARDDVFKERFSKWREKNPQTGVQEDEWIDFPAISRAKSNGEDITPIVQKKLDIVDKVVQRLTSLEVTHEGETEPEDNLDFETGVEISQALAEYINLNVEAVQTLAELIDSQDDVFGLQDSLVFKNWTSLHKKAVRSSILQYQDYQSYPEFQKRANAMEGRAGHLYRTSTQVGWDGAGVTSSVTGACRGSLSNRNVWFSLVLWSLLTMVLTLALFQRREPLLDLLQMPRTLQIMSAFLVSLFLGRTVTQYYRISSYLKGLVDSSKVIAFWLSTWSDHKNQKLEEVQKLFLRWIIAALRLTFMQCSEMEIQSSDFIGDGHLTHREVMLLGGSADVESAGELSIASAEILWTWIGNLLYVTKDDDVLTGKGHEMACREVPNALKSLDGLREMVTTPLPSSYVQIVILVVSCYLGLSSFITAANICVYYHKGQIEHLVLAAFESVVHSLILVAIICVGLSMQQPFLNRDLTTRFSLEHFEQEIMVSLVRQFESQKDFQRLFDDHFVISELRRAWKGGARVSELFSEYVVE